MEIIQPEIEEYSEIHTTPETPVLAKLNRETHLSQVYPRMLSGHLQGTFLKMISHMLKPRRILEVGTFTGYSAICLAEGLTEDGILHTIDVDPELQWIIEKYLTEARLTSKVKLHIGQAESVIPTLHEEWDLVFIDADKPSYLKYYELALPNLRSGGIILADNALWSGKVLETNSSNSDIRGIQEFNEFVTKDDRVENVLLPLRDGVMMIRKK